MRRYGINFWKTVPFLRLLIPLTGGILLSHYGQLSSLSILVTTISGTLILLSATFLKGAARYQYRWLNGMGFYALLSGLGAALGFFQNKENDPLWLGRELGFQQLLVTLEEPPVEKTKSFAAIASADYVFAKGKWKPVKGKLLLSLAKNGFPVSLAPGSRLLISQKIQPIPGPANPGGFNYRQYCAFRNIHFQVFLQPKDYQVTPMTKISFLEKKLQAMRISVLNLLRKYVPGSKESGVAEALLIGYREDLDKDLVRSYSNTGVVHIIAISGLHLGMIYGLLLLLFKPIQKKNKWLMPLIIPAILWGFSLLAGAAASILRSSVMFSFLVIGESLGRKTNIYNTLAASAFCLLVYNPYYFWDVGFQLSYAAVLSIALFQRPLNKLLFFRNRLLKTLWQINAVTLAAQILTLPIILYYFHQFPNLFLFCNFMAVPLSGFILYTELALLVGAAIPVLNVWLGKLVSWQISLLNALIERTDLLPFAVTRDLYITIPQTLLLYLLIAFLAYWLFKQSKGAFLAALGFALVTAILYCQRAIRIANQHKLVVYHIPRYRSIDIFEGKKYLFIGDSPMSAKSQLSGFHLAPSRLMHGAGPSNALPNTNMDGHVILSNGKRILLIDSNFSIQPSFTKIPVDIILISHNPPIRMANLKALFDCNLYVFDGSNPLWKIRYWKKDADSLHLRHYSTWEQGALEVDL